VCFGRYIPTFAMNLIVIMFGFIYVPDMNVTLSSKKLLRRFRFLKYLAAGSLSMPIYGKFVFRFV
jgi:hypothetical protein